MAAGAGTALVTGATDGHGRRVALELAARGWTVVVHGRDRDRADDVARAARGRVHVLLADLAATATARRLGEDALERAARIDVLVDNAGLASEDRRVSADGSS